MANPKFNEESLAKLKVFMRWKPTLEDTAAWFECGKTTVEDTIRKHFDMTFREFREQNMVHTRHDLVRTALQKALKGDNVMLIFCLKNLCEWKDKHDIVQETHISGQMMIGAVTGAMAKEILEKKKEHGTK